MKRWKFVTSMLMTLAFYGFIAEAQATDVGFKGVWTDVSGASPVFTVGKSVCGRILNVPDGPQSRQDDRVIIDAEHVTIEMSSPDAVYLVPYGEATTHPARFTGEGKATVTIVNNCRSCPIPMDIISLVSNAPLSQYFFWHYPYFGDLIPAQNSRIGLQLAIDLRDYRGNAVDLLSQTGELSLSSFNSAFLYFTSLDTGSSNFLLTTRHRARLTDLKILVDSPNSLNDWCKDDFPVFEPERPL